MKGKPVSQRGSVPRKAPMGTPRGDAVSGGKLLRSQSPRTRKERIKIIEEDFGNLPIR